MVLSSEHWYLYIQSYLQEAQALHQQMKERLSEVRTYAAFTAVLCSLVGGCTLNDKFEAILSVCLLRIAGECIVNIR